MRNTLTPRKLQGIYSLVFLLAYLVFTANAISPFPGRLAITHDGGHDPDDLLAAPLECAMIDAAGLNDKLVHFDFLNQLDRPNDETMPAVCLEAAERFNLDKSIFFNCMTQLEQAIANFAEEGNKSTEDNPLWLACAGPMEVPYRLVKAVSPEKRKYIHCVSHSWWNEDNLDGPKLQHTWNDLKELLPAENLHQIRDGNRAWSMNLPTEWSFLSTMGNADYKWVWEQRKYKPGDKFDASDAINVYWIISGGITDYPRQRPEQKSGWEDVKALLSGNSQVGVNNGTIAGNVSAVPSAVTVTRIISLGSSSPGLLLLNLKGEGRSNRIYTLKGRRAPKK